MHASSYTNAYCTAEWTHHKPSTVSLAVLLVTTAAPPTRCTDLLLSCQGFFNTKANPKLAAVPDALRGASVTDGPPRAGQPMWGGTH